MTESNIPPLEKSDVQSGAYLLHLTFPNFHEDAPKYGDRYHFVGYSKDMFSQIPVNMAGEGAKVLSTVPQTNMTLVALFPNHDYKELRRMIVDLGAEQFCPVCQAQSYTPPPPRPLDPERLKYIKAAAKKKKENGTN